jgi:hypothetical protein
MLCNVIFSSVVFSSLPSFLYIFIPFSPDIPFVFPSIRCISRYYSYKRAHSNCSQVPPPPPHSFSLISFTSLPFPLCLLPCALSALFIILPASLWYDFLLKLSPLPSAAICVTSLSASPYWRHNFTLQTITTSTNNSTYGSCQGAGGLLLRRLGSISDQSTCDLAMGWGEVEVTGCMRLELSAVRCWGYGGARSLGRIWQLVDNAGLGRWKERITDLHGVTTQDTGLQSFTESQHRTQDYRASRSYNTGHRITELHGVTTQDTALQSFTE